MFYSKNSAKMPLLFFVKISRCSLKKNVITFKPLSGALTAVSQRNLSCTATMFSDGRSSNTASESNRDFKSSVKGKDELYPGHIATSFLQKTLLSLGASGIALAQPWRDDMVATLGETTGHYALTAMRKKMLADPVGRQILAEKPRINTTQVSLDYLQSLPAGTLGKEYSNFLETNAVSPDSRRPVNFVDDVELAYVMQRYREVHDLMHTLLGMPTNLLGEIVVKWVEGIQTGLPMCLSGAVFAPVRLKQRHMRKYWESHVWWAIRNGYNAQFLMCVYYEHEWETPLVDLRRELGLQDPPKTPHKLKT